MSVDYAPAALAVLDRRVASIDDAAGLTKETRRESQCVCFRTSKFVTNCSSFCALLGHRIC
jgi:hypothetical protein